MQNGKTPVQVEVAELLQGLWTAWLGFSQRRAGGAPNAQTAALASLTANSGASIDSHRVKALQLQLAARQITRWVDTVAGRLRVEEAVAFPVS